MCAMSDYIFLRKEICTFFPQHDNLSDLFVLSIGFERCSPNKAEVNSVLYPKTDYIMHYVIGGKGYLQLNGNNFSIGKDTLFLIPPKSKFAYRPDSSDPWYYMCIEYSGPFAHQFSSECNFTHENPILQPKDDKIFTAFADFLTAFIRQQDQPVVFTMFGLYNVLAEIGHALQIDVKKSRQNHSHSGNPRLNDVIHYINQNYTQPNLSLSTLSSKFHFNPSYLSKIFHVEIGKSISQYIMDLRLCKAFELVQNSDMFIKEISLAVGYEDVGFFSKLFKRKFGESPSLYFKKYVPTI